MRYERAHRPSAQVMGSCGVWTLDAQHGGWLQEMEVLGDDRVLTFWQDGQCWRQVCRDDNGCA